jgi:hypothetical protein
MKYKSALLLLARFLKEGQGQLLSGKLLLRNTLGKSIVASDLSSVVVAGLEAETKDVGRRKRPESALCEVAVALV